MAVGLEGKNGVRIYDWLSGKELFADPNYADSVYGLAFASDGSLVASSRDGQLRRYGPTFRLTAKRGGLAGQQPYGVAIEPAGRRLAVGFVDSPNVSILDAASLAPIAEADVGGETNGSLSNVAWSRDGARIIARRHRERPMERRGSQCFCGFSIQTDGAAVPTCRFRRMR